MIMKRIRRILLIALGLATIYLLLNGIGWAAVFFWKSNAIAMYATVAAMVICPAGAITVVPGSPADSPCFFIPIMGVFFLLWAIVIDALFRKINTTPNQRMQPTASRGP